MYHYNHKCTFQELCREVGSLVVPQICTESFKYTVVEFAFLRLTVLVNQSLRLPILKAVFILKRHLNSKLGAGIQLHHSKWKFACLRL